MPEWLQRHEPDDAALARCPPRSARAARRTPARSSAASPAAGPTGASRNGYFAGEDARAFYDELQAMLALQVAAPNSPQWFNTGLHWAYGIAGPSQGHWYAEVDGTLRRSTSAYERPAPHACFIQSVADDLVNEGGIMDLWTREARVFKYGSGTGSNFSAIRGADERLSGGGRSSGLMSFLKIGDRAAGAIKSGGTTRRAAKMVTLDLDHPDIEQYVRWKVVEETKVAALVAGSRALDRHLNAVIAATEEGEGDERFVARTNPALAQAVRAGARRGRARRLHPARARPRAAGRARAAHRRVRHGLAVRGLHHRLRPELEQLGARHERLHARRRGGRRVAALRAHGARARP